jgi:hypothetical protein
MKRRDPFARSASRARQERLVRTGEHCPSTGWWMVDAQAAADGAPRFFVRGSMMPSFGGAPASWRWIPAS